MNVLFIRSNGKTLHNNPDTKLFVPGEPPQFSNRDFNYRNDCLEGGFARVGWPATDDLRIAGWRTRARTRTARNPSRVTHVGLVQKATNSSALTPYFYQYQTDIGDRFENAHRIYIAWARKPSGEWTSIKVEGLGGLWLQGFARVESATGEVIRQARELSIQS